MTSAVIFDLDGVPVDAGAPHRAAWAAVLGGIGIPGPPDVVAAEDVYQGKPAPDVFVTAARRLGVPPETCLVFEDAVVGVHAGRAAGMRVIGVTTAHTADELTGAGAERCIADFEACRWPM